jgi:beta-glucosidase/6-phospho-beta-glucosidase/beta-galactosidase/ABC-type amino acid transport substrate-binding protein
MNLRTPAPQSRSKAQQPWPPGFLFGVATADHQTEAYDAEREDIWDIWERERDLTRRGRATDFWHRYAEDIAQARRLGCSSFRCSIAWSRVQPGPDSFDEQALDHYRTLIETIRAAGMEPIVTLHHFTWPPHIEARGGLPADDFPASFAGYVARVAQCFGQQVRYWVTFNEPSQLAFGYIKPWFWANYAFPPGLPEGAQFEDQLEAVEKLIRNLFLAHTEARRIIQAANPQALVGANPLLAGLPVILQRWFDQNAIGLRGSSGLARLLRSATQRPLRELGQVDVTIAMLTRTAEREQQVHFSQPYYTAGQALLARADRAAVEPDKLIDGVIAVVRGSTAETAVRATLPAARIRAVDDYRAARHLLDTSQADVLRADDTILKGMLAEYPGRYRIIGERLTEEPYAAAVALGNGDLLDVVNQVVRDYRSTGQLGAGIAPEPLPGGVRSLSALSGSPLVQKIVARSRPVDGRLPLARPGTALRRIQDRGRLIVAVRQDVPGMGHRDPATGAYSGLEIDLARAVAARIFGDPTRIEFQPSITRRRIPALRSAWQWLAPLLRNLSATSALLAGSWWHLGMAGKLPESLCPRACVGQQDFAGLDYYWGLSLARIFQVSRLLGAGQGRFEQAPVTPGLLYDLLRYHARLNPGLPILILENGSVEQADGIDRADYIREHVAQVDRAVAAGIDVIGYTCWSITSNREWGYPFAPGTDFGLCHIELDEDAQDLTRRPTPAAEAYQELILRYRS